MSFAGYYFEFWSIKCDISYYAYFEEIDGNMLFGLATSIKKMSYHFPVHNAKEVWNWFVQSIKVNLFLYFSLAIFEN